MDRRRVLVGHALAPRPARALAALYTAYAGSDALPLAWRARSSGATELSPVGPGLRPARASAVTFAAALRHALVVRRRDGAGRRER